MISDTTSVLVLQQEIQRSEESRYDHRLHGVLLVAQGMTCPEVARLLGDAPRSVEYWFHRFDQRGLSGLTEGERSEFRLRKPRPLLARADPRRQKKHKKTPPTDGVPERGSLGFRRSALSAARIALPHVGSAGDQGSHGVSSSDAEERGLFCRRAFAGTSRTGFPP
jgi:hypothetical protein